MKTDSAILALGALAQESRLAVFRLLIKRGPEGFQPSELSTKLNIPSPTLSFHLRELQRADLVELRREGRNLFYTANIDCINGLVAFLTENCCALSDDACGPDCKPREAVTRRKRA